MLETNEEKLLAYPGSIASSLERLTLFLAIDTIYSAEERGRLLSELRAIMTKYNEASVPIPDDIAIRMLGHCYTELARVIGRTQRPPPGGRRGIMEFASLGHA